MQILKRARNAEMDIIPTTESESNVREEVNRRSFKAGYTTKYGECPHRTKIMNRGYGDKSIRVWPRDKEGNLIGD